MAGKRDPPRKSRLFKHLIPRTPSEANRALILFRNAIRPYALQEDMYGAGIVLLHVLPPSAADASLKNSPTATQRRKGREEKGILLRLILRGV